MDIVAGSVFQVCERLDQFRSIRVGWPTTDMKAIQDHSRC